MTPEDATRNFGPLKHASWWGWILRKPIRDYTNINLPGDDHAEHRELDGKRFHISQPYELRWQELRDLVHHCEQHGLQANIYGDSWHYPGKTFTVIVERDHSAS